MVIGSLIATPFLLVGQPLMNDGARIIIGADVLANITGGIDHQNNGSIDNDGTILVSGNWNNDNAGNGVFMNTDAIGSVIFTGTTEQTIGGAANTDFENVEIANTVVSGPAITLSRDLVVSQKLTLTDGVVTAGANKVVMEHPATGNLLPATPTSASFIMGT